jgi:hypothetical protein
VEEIQEEPATFPKPWINDVVVNRAKAKSDAYLTVHIIAGFQSLKLMQVKHLLDLPENGGIIILVIRLMSMQSPLPSV